jgi:hypothetical protein
MLAGLPAAGQLIEPIQQLTQRMPDHDGLPVRLGYASLPRAEVSGADDHVRVVGAEAVRRTS